MPTDTEILNFGKSPTTWIPSSTTLNLSTTNSYDHRNTRDYPKIKRLSILQLTHEERLPAATSVDAIVVGIDDNDRNLKLKLKVTTFESGHRAM